MRRTRLSYEGLEIYLSRHAYERIVERVYNGMTRDVSDLTYALLKNSKIGLSRPDFITNETYSKVGTVACWLIHDDAGVQFTLPLHCRALNGRQILCATTCLTPVYKARKPKATKAGRKTKLRKHKIGGRAKATTSSGRVSGRRTAARDSF